MVDDVSWPPMARSFYATLVPFPIACFVLAFLTDLAYVASVSVLWETASVWLLAAGLVVAAVAVVGGIADLVRSRGARLPHRPLMTIVGELAAFALALVNVFVHSRDGYTAVVPEGLVLSILTVAILAATLFEGRVRSRRTKRRYA